MSTVALPITSPATSRNLLLCFSHLRWDFVFQRPQHLMTRMAERYAVVFWEEPDVGAVGAPDLRVREVAAGVRRAMPRLPAGLSPAEAEAALARLLAAFLAGEPAIAVRWYYTPMMLAFSRDVEAACTVYDCMDELSAFRFAPPDLLAREAELLAGADLVFTGGRSLYEAKRARHRDVRCFPSSVDVAHFARARARRPGRATMPRLGFYGVIDERMDLALLATLADARPDWTVELVGPVVKIDPACLPRRANLHYPGPRSYDELPATVAGWDVALIPFANNESTRFISPTKTPEYLAAGRPVVSTPIADVESGYGDLQAVRLAAAGPDFVAACDEALALVRGDDATWRDEADALLAAMSWDDTAATMFAAIARVCARAAARSRERTRHGCSSAATRSAEPAMAGRLAAGAGERVLVVDRPQVAGRTAEGRD